MTQNTTMGAVTGAAVGVGTGAAVIWYFDGWDEASDAEKIFALIAGLAAFNVAARSVSP